MLFPQSAACLRKKKREPGDLDVWKNTHQAHGNLRRRRRQTQFVSHNLRRYMWGLHSAQISARIIFLFCYSAAMCKTDAGWTLCCALVVHGGGARFDEKGSKAASVRIPQRVSTAREKLSLCGLWQQNMTWVNARARLHYRIPRRPPLGYKNNAAPLHSIEKHSGRCTLINWSSAGALAPWAAAHPRAVSFFLTLHSVVGRFACCQIMQSCYALCARPCQ